MQRKRRLIWVYLGFAALAVCIAALLATRGGRGALEQRHEQLRASGEKLTVAELELPVEGTQEAVAAFEQVAARLEKIGRPAGWFSGGLMSSVEDGRFIPVWSRALPPDLSREGSPDWDDLHDLIRANERDLEELRRLLREPPADRGFRMTELRAAPRSPYVLKRQAAQVFSLSAMLHLQRQQPHAATSDLKAMIRLAQLHRNEMTLVNPMIRVAIANLGLAATWEWLQSPDLAAEDLREIQQAWSEIDLLAALEAGLGGDRAFGLEIFHGLTGKRGSAASAVTSLFPAGNSLLDRLLGSLHLSFWRTIDSSRDELFYLDVTQFHIAAVRSARQGAAVSEILPPFRENLAQTLKVFESPGGRLRHPISAMIIPNFGRALETAAKAETLRRLTITGLALRLYAEENHEHPESLEALVPGWLNQVPPDPMDALPLKYRRTGQTEFLLYSSGVNGLDDGGDPGHAVAASASWNAAAEGDWWAGPDAVWPARRLPISLRPPPTR